MSEWFKEHDWKSCDGGDSSGGSNPLLCATQSPPQSGLFAWRREEVREVRHSPEVARGGGEARRGERAKTKPDDEALPRGPLRGAAKSSRHAKPATERAFCVAQRRSRRSPAFTGGRARRRRSAERGKGGNQTRRRSFAVGTPSGVRQNPRATRSPPLSGLFAWRREEAGEVRSVQIGLCIG